MVAADGTQAFFYYDTTDGSTGIKFVTSTDNFASVSSATTVVSGQGAGGFAVELDQESDTIFVAMTGSGGSNNYYLRVYPLTYSSGTRTWSVGTPVDVQSNTSASYPRWSGASVVIERGSSQDYVWVGADEQTASTSYTSRAWHATLTSGSLGGTWTNANPPFTASTTYVHYGALVAITNGVAAVGRDAGQQKGAVYARGNGWGTLEQLTGKYAWGGGKEFSLLAVADPLSPGTATFVPLAVYPTDDDGTKTAMKLHVRRYNTTTWTNDALPSVANDDASPAAAWDGTSFYVFRLKKKNSLTDWQINGHRGKLTAGQFPAVELDPDRTWIVEATGNKDINWLALPRTLGTEIIPFFYIRDKSSDELVVQTKRIDLLGDRKTWAYQEFKMQGAGILKVNFANGNLHYETDDAKFPARRWNDQIKRVYNSQSDLSTIMSTGWTGLATPRLQFFDGNDALMSSSNGTEKRIMYWMGDGSKYVYLKDNTTWKPELGMKMTLEKRTNDSNGAWRVTDLYGQTTYFDSAGKPTIKWDFEGTNNATWTWNYDGSGTLTSIAGVKQTDGSAGRTQNFTFTNGKVTQIKLAKPGANLSTCATVTPVPDCYVYDYAYDGNGRLQYATLVSNSTEFDGSQASKWVRLTYGYDANGLLSSITTPEGSVYSIGYDSFGRVAWVDLPDPSTGAQSNCNRGTGRHCWEFAYAEGQGQVTVTDSRGYNWVYKTLGSGPIYEMQDPLGNKISRTWTAEQNQASETDPLGNTTFYEYDTNGNRTKIVDPVNGSAHPTTFTFNAANRRTSKTDPRGNTITYTYTGTGDPDVETDPENFRVDRDYNTFRLMTQLTDARNKVITYTYESLGQLLTETRPDGSKTTFTRDTWGRITEVRIGGTTPSSSDHITVTTYDDLGRAKEVRVRMGADPTQNNSADLVTSKSLDRDGNPRSVTDPLGGVVTISTDRRSRVVAIDPPIGNGGSDNANRPCTAYEYDEVGNQTKVRVAISRGASASCSFNASGITWSEAQRTFDARNLKTDETLLVSSGEYSGGTITTSWQYDAAGRNTRITDPRGKYVEMSYDALGRKLSEKAAVALAGVTGPDCHGISGAVCVTKHWDYDEVGNVKNAYIPRGTASPQVAPNVGQGERATSTEVVRSYTYDKVQRLLTKKNELDKTWSYSYDGNGNRLTETDPLNHTTTWTYDERNRVLTVTNAVSSQTIYSYDKFGNRASLTDPNGNLTTYTYDKNNRLIEVRDPLGKTTSYTYDKSGNRSTITDPRTKTQSFQYDALNRLTQETSPSAYACTPTCAEAARSATYTYTLDGQRSVVTDSNGTQMTSGYDSARRLKSIDYPTGTADVGYTYDKAGNRAALKEDGTTSAEYTYDELNRLRFETRDPGPNQKVVEYRYDRRDTTHVVYPDGKTVAYTYDEAARLDYLDDWRQTGPKRTDFGYDDANRKTTQSFPSGAYSQWQYDNANRLAQVEHKTSSSGTVFARFAYTYDPAGNRVSQDDYDGTTTYNQAFEYDGVHRLIRETPRSGISTVPNTYGYDEAGNRVATGTGQALVEDDSGSLSYSGGNASVSNSNASGGSYTRISGTGNYVEYTFTGDAVAFIYSTNSDAGTVRLTLDPGGANIVLADINQCGATSWQKQKTFTGLSNGTHTLRVAFQSTCPGSVDNHVTVDAFRAYTQAKTHTYDDDNRLKRASDATGNTDFEYDQNGSMTKKIEPKGNETKHAYDAARRLTDVSTRPSGGSWTSQASFAYDGDGRRMSKTAGGATTTYVNDTRGLTQVLQETRSGNTLTYIPGLLQHDPSQSTETAKWAYFHQDAQNNRALSDNAASRSKWWEYDPFGIGRPGTTGAANSDVQYAGEQKDPETGLINLRARYYDPTIGRFVARDATSTGLGFPQTFNRYAYAFNNPLRVLDPSGYGCAESDCGEWMGQGGRAAAGSFAMDLSLETLIAKAKEAGLDLSDNVTANMTKEQLIEYLNSQGFDQYELENKPLDQVLDYFRAYLFVNAFPNEYFDVFQDPYVEVAGRWTYSGFVGRAAFNDVLANPPASRDWSAMPEALQNLANLPIYQNRGRIGVAEFVHDVAWMFAGVPSRFEGFSLLESITLRAEAGNPRVNLHPSGLDPDYMDPEPGPTQAKVHHWAWSFAMGFQFGGVGGHLGNELRERRQNPTNPDAADQRMGAAGARMGSRLASQTAGYAPGPRPNPLDQIGDLMRENLPIR